MNEGNIIHWVKFPAIHTWDTDAQKASNIINLKKKRNYILKKSLNSMRDSSQFFLKKKKYIPINQLTTYCTCICKYSFHERNFFYPGMSLTETPFKILIKCITTSIHIPWYHGYNIIRDQTQNPEIIIQPTKEISDRGISKLTSCFHGNWARRIATTQQYLYSYKYATFIIQIICYIFFIAKLQCLCEI